MPANAGIHGGERRNLAIGMRARAKVLDPRFRGDECVRDVVLSGR